jgi:hypothetical protein
MNVTLPQNSTGMTRLASWVRRPENAFRRWLGRPTAVVAWGALLVAVLLPPHGLGFTVCTLNATTGVPCLGCGLTRSLSCGVRGMFHESWQYHPFGLLVLTIFATAAITSLFPKRWRSGIAGFMQAHAQIFNGLYLAFVIAFVLFGIVRAIVHVARL